MKTVMIKNIRKAAIAFAGLFSTPFGKTLEKKFGHIIDETPTKYDFITSERYINSIEWEDSISLFHDLNSLHIIFYEKSLSNKHNRTKKIYIPPSKSKTRRKYI